MRLCAVRTAPKCFAEILHGGMRILHLQSDAKEYLGFDLAMTDFLQYAFEAQPGPFQVFRPETMTWNVPFFLSDPANLSISLCDKPNALLHFADLPSAGPHFDIAAIKIDLA